MKGKRKLRNGRKEGREGLRGRGKRENKGKNDKWKGTEETGS